MQKKRMTKTQWFIALLLIAVCLAVVSKKGTAESFTLVTVGVGCFFGILFGLPDAEGKRHWGKIAGALAIAIAVGALGIGLQCWLKHTPLPKPLAPWLPNSGTQDWIDTIWHGTFAVLGWCCGTVAAGTRKDWKHALPFAVALLLVVGGALPGFAVALIALRAPETMQSWITQILLITEISAVALCGFLLLIAGFRHEVRACRCWFTLGVVTLLAWGAWGGAALYFRWQIWQLKEQYPYPPMELTEKQLAARELWQQMLEAEAPLNALEVLPPQLRTYSLEPGEALPQETEFAPVPPVLGLVKWLPEQVEATQAGQPLASEAHKEKVLAVFDSPESVAFYEAAARFLKEERLILVPDFSNFADGTVIPPLSRIRALAQRLLGAAQLHHYRREPEKVMRDLDLALRVGEVWPGEPMLITQLIRVAIDRIALNGIVSLAPDGAEYVPYYRDWLWRVMARRYDQPGEPAWQTVQWDMALAGRLFRNAPESSASWESWLVNPLELQLLIRQFHKELAAQSELEQIRACVGSGRPALAPLRDIPRDSYHQRAMLSFLRTEAYLRTALALKLYRSLHGAYPESLNALVPELLPALPNEPTTGKPLEYRKTDDSFTLYTNDDRDKPLSSLPNY